MTLRSVDEQAVWNVIHLVESVLMEADVDYENAFAACLYIAAVSANNIHMGKDLFLKNCEAMHKMDIDMMLKEMQ